MSKALIFGITGQDGSYMTELLLEKGYEVHGLYRKSATGNTRNIQHLIDNPDIYGKAFFLHRGDLADATSIYRVINEVRPREIYNLADQDHVRWSYDMVDYSSDITGAAVARTLEMIKQIDKNIRFFQPCTSNMFGLTDSNTQNERTPFNPQSPYAIAKTFAYYMNRYYRQSYGLFAATAIFFNHESPRRTPEYVTRKITQSAARIVAGKQDKLVLGDLTAKIDWGYSCDYVEAAWNMLQQDNPDDFVIATGETHSVKEFVDETFALAGLDVDKYVETTSSLLRPSRTSELRGDTSKAQAAFGFKVRTRFKDLVKLMYDADLRAETS